MNEPVTIGNATLYCGDCRDITPVADAFISDPPYGIDFKYDGDYKDEGGDKYSDLLKVFIGKKSILLQYPEETMKYFVPLLGVPDDCVAWCYNSNLNRQFRLWSFFGIKPDFSAYKIPAKNGLDKRILAHQSSSQGVKSYDWFCDLQQVKNVSEEKTDHPCQISVAQMERIVLLSQAKIVCDPFMGSGSTGVACINHGVEFIGIEREPKYFDIACERIQQAQAQHRLFA